MAKIDDLELIVKSDSDSAIKSLEALSSSLANLKSVTKGGTGLQKVTNKVSKLDSTLSSLDVSKIDKLASSLSRLKSVEGIKISSSIGTQIRKISEATVGLKTVDLSKVKEIPDALNGLSTIQKSSGLNSVINSIKKLPELSKELKQIDLDSFKQDVEELTKALKPLTDELSVLSAAYQRLPSRLTQTHTLTNKIKKANSKAGMSYINLYAKLKMAYSALRIGTQYLAESISKSNSYIENLNLFTASMGKYSEEAKKYAEEVSDLMGIDPAEWLRNQGVFNTIISGFGVAGDKAALMSKNLTQLGYDLSSFYNMPYQEAMQKIQSGIAGELEPLRRLGYDLSVARLQQEAYRLGIDRSVNSMTQAEKSQLRYYAIMTQVSVAHNDMARTINAPSNQLRVLQAQIVQVSRALGNVFIPILNAVLPYLIALAKGLRIVLDVFSKLFGFKLPEIDYSGISQGAGAVGDLSDALGDATGKAKKLKNNLLGIDELNIISQDNGNGGLGGAGLPNVGGDLDIPLPEYDFLNGLVESKVNELVNKFKEWAGLTEEIDTWSEFFHTKLGRILILVGEIAGAIALWKLSNNFLTSVINLKQHLRDLKEFQLDKPLTILAGGIVSFTGLVIEWTGLKSIIQDGIDNLNVGESVVGSIMASIGGAILGIGAKDLLAVGITQSAIASGLGASLAGALFGGGIAGIVAGLPAFVTGVMSSIKDGLSGLSVFLTEFGAGLTGMGAGAIGAALGAWGGPVGVAVGGLIGIVVGALTNFGIWLSQNWEETKKFIDDVGNFITDLPNFLDEKMSGFYTWLWAIPQSISNFFGDMSTNIDTWFKELWSPIRNFDFKKLGEDVATGLSNMFSYIFSGRILVDLVVWIEQMKQPILDFFINLPAWLIGVVGKIIGGLCDVGMSIFAGILDGLWQAISGIGEFITGLIDGFKEALGIHSPSTVARDEIGLFFGKGILDGIAKPFANIGKWLKENIISPISNFLKNNPVTDLVINVKNTVDSWWDSIKSWWNGETNNDSLSTTANVGLKKNNWTTVQNFIGEIKPLNQAIQLVKNNFSNVANWVKEQGSTAVSSSINLIKNTWHNVTDWVKRQGSTFIDSSVSLLRNGWSNVTDWVRGRGNTGSNSIVSLLKNGWNNVSNWVSSFGTNSNSPISLIKRGWQNVSNWVSSFGTNSSSGVGLWKNGWSSLSSWITNWATGSSSGVGLWRSGWSSLANWVYNWSTSTSSGVSLWRNGWSTVANWIYNQGSSAVSIGVSLWKNGWNSLKSWFGLEKGGVISAHGVKLFANGGVITPNIPMYGRGAAPTHGSMFVAGENGAEMVGHIGGRTEVMNRFQLSQVMEHSILGAILHVVPHLRALNNKMAECTNAMINALLVTSNNSNLAFENGISSQARYNMSRDVYDRSSEIYNRNSNNFNISEFETFYYENIDPKLTQIADNTKKQADKNEKFEVNIGTKKITEEVKAQEKADGYSFTK